MNTSPVQNVVHKLHRAYGLDVYGHVILEGTQSNLKEVRLIVLDMGALVAGAGGMGKNLLKQMLARSQLKCVGVTTFDEYNKYVEKDSEFRHHFQQVYGSRSMSHWVDRKIVSPLSQMLLTGEIDEKSTIKVFIDALPGESSLSYRVEQWRTGKSNHCIEIRSGIMEKKRTEFFEKTTCPLKKMCNFSRMT